MLAQRAIAVASASVALASCCLDISGRDESAGTSNGGGATTGGGCHAASSVPGTVTTLAGGDGGVLFGAPRGLASDSSGNVYVSDFNLSRLDEIDCAGAILPLGSASPPPLGDFGIAVDSAGNVYAASNWTSKILKIDPRGVTTTVAGNGAQGWVDGSARDGTAEFNQPDDVAVDSSGNLFVADTGNIRIRKIDPTGNVTTLAGDGDAGYQDGTGGPQGTAEFDSPEGVAVDSSGDVYVADTGNFSIRKIDPRGNVTTLAGHPGPNSPGYADGTGGPNGTAIFSDPEGVAVDGSANVYVADGDRIRKIDASGNVTTLAGNGVQGYLNGTLGASGTAEFWSAQAVAVDASGNVYVSDVGNGRIRMITP